MDITDEASRQREFPVCARRIFLAHAAICPLPRRVAAAMQAFTEQSMTAGPDEYVENLKIVRAARGQAARLLDVAPEEIALVGPTSAALSLIAAGLDWAPGDEVIFSPDDYPANVYPWMNLERRGVTPKPLPAGDLTPESVERALTPRTRLVSLASAFFLNGRRIDVDAIGQMLRARGILFCVDAIQTLGAYPLSGKHADFLCADAHKWMLGPLAAGIMMVKREHFERLRPVLLGASNVRSPEFIAQSEIVFSETAARYESGALNLGPIIGLNAALELLLEVGIEEIAGRIQKLCAQLGSPDTGFVSIQRDDAAEAQRRLAAKDVVVSLRRDRQGKSYLRLSPHFYNTAAEIETVLATL